MSFKLITLLLVLICFSSCYVSSSQYGRASTSSRRLRQIRVPYLLPTNRWEQLVDEDGTDKYRGGVQLSTSDGTVYTLYFEGYRFSFYSTVPLSTGRRAGNQFITSDPNIEYVLDSHFRADEFTNHRDNRSSYYFGSTRPNHTFEKPDRHYELGSRYELKGGYEWTSSEPISYDIEYNVDNTGFRANITSTVRIGEFPETCITTRQFTHLGQFVDHIELCYHAIEIEGTFSTEYRTYSSSGRLLSNNFGAVAGAKPGITGTHDTKCAEGFTGPDCRDRLGVITKPKSSSRSSRPRGGRD